MHNHIPRTDCPVVVLLLLLIAYTNCPLHTIYISTSFVDYFFPLFCFRRITKRVNFVIKIERESSSILRFLFTSIS